MDAKPDYEKQLVAMRTVMEALQPLEEAAREAVFAWVASQLGIRSAVNKPTTSGGSTPPTGASTRPGTVSVVAQKLGVKSARDLLLAAAAYLTLYQGKDSFSKDELVAAAKEARGWKTAYSNQIASNIKRMSDAGELFERARDVFSLSDEAITDVEGRLAK